MKYTKFELALNKDKIRVGDRIEAVSNIDPTTRVRGVCISISGMVDQYQILVDSDCEFYPDYRLWCLDTSVKKI